MEKEMIKIIDAEGVETEVEMVSILEDETGTNQYLIYTKGEVQKSGNKVLYVAKLVNSASGYGLDNIEDDTEWMNVKKIMSKIVSK